ncbi:Nucleoside triphosphatase NudI [uncultured archaeon]|nr:Nucleoside triphosphatase NudI [uncultured archaeon]
MKKQFYIVKGLVECNGKYLVLKRKFGLEFDAGKWECSGGKIRENEKPEQTFIRELFEETGLNTKKVREISVLEGETDLVKSKCHVFFTKVDSRKVKLGEDHIAYKWIKPENFKNLELATFADLLTEYFNNPKKYLTI